MPPTVDLSRPLWRSFLAFLGPMMLSNILQALSGTVSSIYLGQMIGPDALAAAGVFFPIVFFFISLVIGMGAGASVLIGQAWGAGDRDQVKRVAGTTLGAALLVGLAMAAALTPAAGWMLRGLATPPRVLPGAIAYAGVILAFSPVFFAFLLMTQLLRGVGDTVTPLWTLALSIAIAVVLTPALIRGWLGLPRLGVAAAAWSAAISWTVTTAWLMLHLRRRRHPLAPDAIFLGAMWPRLSILRVVLRLGIPSALQMVMMALAEMVLLGLVNRFGAAATTAYGAVNQVLAYTQFPALSVAITVTILSAQTIGAGRVDRLAAILRAGLLINLLLTGTLVLLAYLFSGSLVRLFVADAAIRLLTQRLLHIVLWSAVVYGAASILSGQMRASGDVMVPTALSILAILAVEVPVAWVLSGAIGIDGVWIGYPASFVAMLLLQYGYFRLRWRHQPIARLA